MTPLMPVDVPIFAKRDVPPPDRAIAPANSLPPLPVLVYDPTSNTGTIDALQPRTEFELQAWLFNRLNLDGFDGRGEI